MQSSLGLLTYRVLEKMKDWDRKGALRNDHPANRYIKRKGGKRRVKKGFAKTLTSEKAREYVNKRWHNNSAGTSTEQEERQADS